MSDLYVLQYHTGSYYKYNNLYLGEITTSNTLEDAQTFLLEDVLEVYSQLYNRYNWTVYKVGTRRVLLEKYDPDKAIKEIQDLEDQIQDLTKKLEEKRAELKV